MYTIENEVIKAKESALDFLNRTVSLQSLTIDDVRKQLRITQEQSGRSDISIFDNLVNVFYLTELAELYKKKLRLINASQIDDKEFRVAFRVGLLALEFATIFSRSDNGNRKI